MIRAKLSIAAMCLALSGCGTMADLFCGPVYCGTGPDAYCGRAPYGGVEMDLALIHKGVDEGAPPLIVGGMVDLPLSATADTVLAVPVLGARAAVKVGECSSAWTDSTLAAIRERVPPVQTYQFGPP